MKRFGIAIFLLLIGQAAFAFDLPFSRKPAALAASGTIQVVFTPEDDATALIVQAIHDAKKQVLVQTFSFTSRDIAQALIAAKQRGVDVQIIADAEQIRRMERGKVPEMAAAGVPTFVDSRHDSAHNKVMLLDPGAPNAVLITGSFNFTHAAQFKNAENVLIFRGNPPLVAAYLHNWQQHREHASAFSRQFR